MSRTCFKLIQMMNVMSVVLFLLCCLHSLHSRAEPNGAVTVVKQEDDGGTSVEVNGETEEESEVSSERRQSYDTFIPTQEWQTIQEGQAIPPGLHVRMSMKTGLKEAKLMDGDDGERYKKIDDGDEGMDKKQFTVDELKKALKDFKTTKLDETDLQREAEVKSKFRSYEELKRDFQAMNMNIETDGEIVTRLVDTLKKPDLDRDKHLIVLKDLEYYLHQIDNAVFFKDIGGIPILLKDVNTTKDEELQIEAAMVLGTASSLNPKVQIEVLDAGGLQVLLPVLSTSSSVDIQRKMLFAISATCRHFPFAQKKFLELGGLSAVEKLIKDGSSDKLKIKTLSFLTDLLTEKLEVLTKTDPEKQVEVEKLQQYEEVPLQETMVEHGWCELVPGLLHVSDHDSREKVLKTMHLLGTVCKGQFSSAKSVLHSLKSEYTDLAKSEAEDNDIDGYFTDLLSVVSEVLGNIKTKEEL